MGVDRDAWADVPDATKWVDELRGETEREWVGLTDAEINEWAPEIHGMIRAIEAKLKEKNNG
jgi:hypothetical protein